MTEPLEQRIAILERRTRRWQFFALIALVAAFASLATLSIKRQPPAEIQARQFSLVNGSGEVLAQLRDDPTYGPFLILHAKHVGADVVLGSMQGDAGVGIVAQGETRIALAVGKYGTSLSLSDGKGKTRFLAALRDDGGTPTVLLSDGNGGLILEAARMRLRDENGTLLFSTPTMNEVSGKRE